MNEGSKEIYWYIRANEQPCTKGRATAIFSCLQEHVAKLYANLEVKVEEQKILHYFFNQTVT